VTTLDEKAARRLIERFGTATFGGATDQIEAYKAGYRDALAEPTEAEIEVVARALRAEEWKGHAPSWEKESPSSQQYWRDSARAALSAFLKARTGSPE